MKCTPKQLGLVLITILCGLLCRTTNAEKCDVHTLADPDIVGRNFQIELPAQQTLTLVGIMHMPNDQRKEATQLFSTLGGSDLEEKIVALLTHQLPALTSQTPIVDYLKKQLAQKPPPNYVGMESAPKDLPRWLAAGEEIYPYEQSQSRLSGFRPGLWQNLMLITVEPTMYVRLTEPELFFQTEFVGLDLAAAYKPVVMTDTKPKKSDNANQRLERLTAEIRNSLRDNPRTRNTFDRLVRSFDPSSRKYRGWSDQKIRNSVTAHVWRQDRGNFARWVDAKIAARRQRSTPAEPETQKKVIAFDSDQLAQQISQFKGSGIIIVTAGLLQPVAKALVEACKKLK